MNHPITLFFVCLATSAGQICAHITIISLISNPFNVCSWAIVLCIRATSVWIVLLAGFIFLETSCLISIFFPFASAPSASTIPSSATTFPDHEPVAYNDHMRRYRLELLATDNPVECCSLPLSGSGSPGGSTTPRVTLPPLAMHRWRL
jgi:hypothetical protein